jgi:thioredoxin-like negative regulator of GroEL
MPDYIRTGPVAGLQGVRATCTADLSGTPLDPTATGDDPGRLRDLAAALRALSAAGTALGLSGLQVIRVNGPRLEVVARVEAGAFLLVDLDPGTATAPVMDAVREWTPPARPSASAAPRESGRAPWADLRRALVRGHIMEARVHLGGGENGRPTGSDSVAAPDVEAAFHVLVEGIGRILSGDAVGGERTLRELAEPTQPNPSFRWLALHWCARASLGFENLSPARRYVKEALDVARSLDVEARAVSHLTAAELMTRIDDFERALKWLSESRSRFEQAGDRWGIARTRLAEARVHAAAGREAESAEAARQGWAIDPDWDEPAVFLASRAILAGNVAEAEGILAAVHSPPADRLRVLLEALRHGDLSQSDAAGFLREQGAPADARSLRALIRISGSSPRFPHVREALAWKLVHVGKYAEAGALFRGLLGRSLSPADRAAVLVGLDCVAEAIRSAVPARDRASAPAAAVPAAPVPVGASTDLGALASLSDSTLAPRVEPGIADVSNVVFSGRLNVLSLPDLIEFLRSARRTGLLACSAGERVGSLRFQTGWIVDGVATGAPGMATLPIGEEDGGGALRLQVETVIREILRWSDGDFVFTSDASASSADPDPRASVDPQAVLLQIYKDSDEAARSAGGAER